MQHTAAALIAALAPFALQLAHSSEVYRCKDEGGRTVIQQAPCIDGSKVRVRPASGPGGGESSRAESTTNQEIISAIAHGQPAVGMSRAQLDSVMGPPTRVNHSNYRGSKRDQIVYRRPDGTWYVYVADGRVESLQFLDRGPAPVRSNCPTALEIRNLETSASSVTITDEQRRSLRTRIDDAKRCR